LLVRVRAAYHAPGTSRQEGKAMRYEGFGGLIVLIADVWAIVNILQSGASTGNKVLWTVIVILLPILGFILWFFLGPRTRRA
jgi:Phospholipase_D-nuclease N-terminal